MKVIHLIENNVQDLPCVATIGFFDGVHRGHQFLIGQLVDEAKRRGMASAVITFDCHPRQVLHSDETFFMLSTLDEKILALSKTGIDLCVVVPFTKELAAMSAQAFMGNILKPLNVKVLLTGYDNRFGHNRSEGFDDYVAYGSQLGIDVIASTPYSFEGETISSSLIRSLISNGDVERAELYLGNPYIMNGRVVEGYHIGRSLHFPTANVELAGGKLVPRHGVYAVKVRLDSSMEFKQGMMNIGNRPTFSGSATTIEVNVFNCKEHLYGTNITVAVCYRLRDEQKFESKEALMQQLRKDAEMAKEKMRLSSAESLTK